MVGGHSAMQGAIWVVVLKVDHGGQPDLWPHEDVGVGQVQHG